MSPETIAHYREKLRSGWKCHNIATDHLRELLDAIDPPDDVKRDGGLQEPPADAVRVRIAVVMDEAESIGTCACGELYDDADAMQDATTCHGMDTGRITHRAIVVADIPKLRTPEVAGRVEEVSG